MTKFHISVALPGKRITDHTTSFKKKKKNQCQVLTANSLVISQVARHARKIWLKHYLHHKVDLFQARQNDITEN